MSDGITPLNPNQEATQERLAIEHGYIIRVLLALDMFCNVVLFRGRLDETISTHSARAAVEGKCWGIWMSKFLNLFEKDHGAKASAGDLIRAESIVSTEEDSGILPK
jgi:hypothetical protein